MAERVYIACDLKSFYASVECVDRNLEPLEVNLVVADESRTEKTICLAVSPALKSYGIPGRARLFEVQQKVKEVNALRRMGAPGHTFSDKSWEMKKLQTDPTLEVDFIIAKPRMKRYMEVSAKIYEIYLRYVAPEDIFSYSIDEVFIDATPYLMTYEMSARELSSKILADIYEETKITGTVGIGTNLYLAKVAMDMVAKRAKPDQYGTRIAQLDEGMYRQLLWEHRPLTDFWRVGPGYRKKLEENGLYTMGDIARCSIGEDSDYYNEELLYQLFGVNAEILIDHAWGYEPVTMAQVKAYQPREKCISSGQVLTCPYTTQKARIVVAEMADELSMSLMAKGLLTDQLVLDVGYDIENTRGKFQGELKKDRYGRQLPKQAHGSQKLDHYTCLTSAIVEAAMKIYDTQVNQQWLVRRINLSAGRLLTEKEVESQGSFEQMELFWDVTSEGGLAVSGEEKKQEEKKIREEKELDMQRAVLSIKDRYGKNAILRGTNFVEGATMRERNGQIGGHRA